MAYNWEDSERLGELYTALYYNPQSFESEDVDKILGVVEGERDEAEWYWVVSLKDGQFALIHGGCDYTGWDCRSHLDSYVVASPENAIDKLEDIDPWYMNSYHGGLLKVQGSLYRQVNEGKLKTRRELVGEALFS